MSPRLLAPWLVLLASACGEHHVLDDHPFPGSCVSAYSDCSPSGACHSVSVNLACGESMTARNGDTFECRCASRPH